MEEQKSPESTKSVLQQALEKQFEALLETLNGRLKEAGDQVLGLSKWIQVQLQIISNKMRKVEVTQSVIDVTFTSMLELMLEKGVITDEEFKKKCQEVTDRKNADAPI